MPPSKSPQNGQAPPEIVHAETPHSLEFEQAVLAAMIASNDAAEELADLVRPSDFHYGPHRQILDAITRVQNRGGMISPLLVEGEMERLGTLNRPYLESLSDAGNFYAAPGLGAHYAGKLQKLGARRLLIEAGRVVVSEAHREEDPEAIAERAQTLIDQAMVRRETLKEADASEWLSRAVLAASAGKTPAIATGFAALDRRMKLRKKQLWLLAGRPSMGKTAMGLAIWLGAAKHGTPAVLYSLEMTEAENTARVLAAETGLHSETILGGDVESWQAEKILQATERMYELPALIVDDADATVAAIRAHVRKLIRTRGVQLVIIDQAQTISVRENCENENIRHTRMAYALKNMAKSLDVCVIVQNQLSRLNERREAQSRRPMLSDIRDSGSWEQAADGVMMVHREEYYTAQKGTVPEPRHQRLELLIRKQRNGWKGPVMLHYDLLTQKIADRDERRAGQEPPGGITRTDDSDEPDWSNDPRFKD